MSRIKIALFGLSMAAGLAVAATPCANAGSYNFTTYDNPADLTFNQLLGINNAGTIVGYFGSGATGHPNQGYVFTPPSSYTQENFLGSAQTQVIGINNTGTNVGFYANTAGANFGFVDTNGDFNTVVDPNTPASATAVNQLLGVNDSNIAVGFYNDANGASHSYTYSIANNSFTGISAPSAVSLTASDILTHPLIT